MARINSSTIYRSEADKRLEIAEILEKTGFGNPDALRYVAEREQRMWHGLLYSHYPLRAH